MATTHPASSFEVGKRVKYTPKNSDVEIMARVKKIIGGENDLVKLTIMEGENEGDEVNIRASRLRKVRGPEKGTPRGKAAVEDDSAESDDDGGESDAPKGNGKAQTSADPKLLSEESIEELLGAMDEIKLRLSAHRAAVLRAKNKPEAPKKTGILGNNKGRRMAEDESE